MHNLEGNTQKAQVVSGEILHYMKQFSSVAKKSQAPGQYEDHEMAHAYMGVGDYEKALAFALVMRSFRLQQK